MRLVSTEKRTIARLWRDAVAAGRPTPAYLVQHDDHWHELSWAEAAERVEGYANGLLSLGPGELVPVVVVLDEIGRRLSTGRHGVAPEPLDRAFLAHGSDFT